MHLLTVFDITTLGLHLVLVNRSIRSFCWLFSLLRYDSMFSSLDTDSIDCICLNFIILFLAFFFLKQFLLCRLPCFTIFAPDILQVSVIGYIPYFGKAMNFVLLSLIYAYYCFEYVHVNVFQHSFNCPFQTLCICRFPLWFYTFFAKTFPGTNGTSLL